MYILPGTTVTPGTIRQQRGEDNQKIWMVKCSNIFHTFDIACCDASRQRKSATNGNAGLQQELLPKNKGSHYTHTCVRSGMVDPTSVIHIRLSTLVWHTRRVSGKIVATTNSAQCFLFLGETHSRPPCRVRCWIWPHTACTWR